MATYLGIEGGATKTVAILVTASGQLLKRIKAGPGNVRLMSDEELGNHIQGIFSSFPKPSSIGIGLAGARDEKDCLRIGQQVARFHPDVPVWVGNDCDTALETLRKYSLQPSASANIIAICGTGSCIFGRHTSGLSVKVGGWGHVLGDHGSGYNIGHSALRLVLKEYDYSGQWPELGQDLLRALQMNEPNQLIDWAQNAQIGDIAALTVEIFRAWKQRNDSLADDVIKNAASALAQQVCACAKRLVSGNDQPINVAFFGSILKKQPLFWKLVESGIIESVPNAVVQALTHEGPWGAVELAKEHAPSSILSENNDSNNDAVRVSAIPDLISASPTELRNPHSMDIDKKPLIDSVELMLREEEKVPGILLKEKLKITNVVTLISHALQSGGRLFYVGAGTSGRLGVLDATECPPTFSTPPELVQGIIAGGQRALWTSIEDAEDSCQSGARAVDFRGVRVGDVLVGIATSGRTPFVWGALQRAKELEASTVFICFNPNLRFKENSKPDIIICPSLGPEVLTGSTRLKAGTATKLLLNIFTTLTMVQIGKVHGNLMVDLSPSNDKLRDRAVRIVCTLTGIDPDVAKLCLLMERWDIKAAVKSIEILHELALEPELEIDD